MSLLTDAQAQVAAAQPLAWIPPPQRAVYGLGDYAVSPPDENGIVHNAGLAVTILLALGYDGDSWSPSGNQYVRFDPALDRTRFTNADSELKCVVCCPIELIDSVIQEIREVFEFSQGLNIPAEKQKHIAMMFLWGDLRSRYPLPGGESWSFVPLVDARPLYQEQLTGGFDDLSWNPVPPPFGQGGEGRPA